MKLTVLVDNNTCIDRYYLGEPAFSVLIETEKRSILLDTGYSDVYQENARRMGIDLKKIDSIVLSHGHNDHTGGLRYIEKLTQPVTLYAHPDATQQKTYQGLDVGCPVAFHSLPENINVMFSKQPLAICDKLWFLGEIPRYYPFEGYPLETDALADDTALVYEGKDGLFLITGCSHSGICNIVRYAKELLHQEVTGILGGFHLLDNPKQTEDTARILTELGVKRIYPCHCTDLKAKMRLAEDFAWEEVYVGKEIRIA